MWMTGDGADANAAALRAGAADEIRLGCATPVSDPTVLACTCALELGRSRTCALVLWPEASEAAASVDVGASSAAPRRACSAPAPVLASSDRGCVACSPAAAAAATAVAGSALARAPLCLDSSFLCRFAWSLAVAGFLGGGAGCGAYTCAGEKVSAWYWRYALNRNSRNNKEQQENGFPR